MLIIGSRALVHHFPNITDINDYDYIGTEKEVLKWFIDNKVPYTIKEYPNLKVYSGVLNNIIHEFEIAEIGNSGYDYLEISKNKEYSLEYANLNILYSIKKSHINQPINWLKHIVDYHILKDILIEDFLKDITDKRIKETEYRLNSKTPNLNQTVQDFVKESQSILKRIYDHDDLHKIVAYYNEPLYFRIQPSKDKVMCSKKLWDNLSYDDKIKCVLEEAYVIALERKIVPMLFQKGSYCRKEDAVIYSLMRICTTLASGWFRDFATDNYFNIKNNINYNFIDNFLEKCEKKSIKLYTEN